MGNLFKRLSSLLEWHGADAAQTALPLDGNVTEPPVSEPSRRVPSRALNAVVRASTSVVVAQQSLPLASGYPQQAHLPGGVDLTETEQIRLRIMQAQIKLSNLGLYDGPVNGVMTLDTLTGVRHFQTLKGLRDSGLLTAATMRALLGPPVRRG